MADNTTVIIRKKKKGGGHGHHGGAWKVAYADFVTAMMAFFLLMWLLNATEAENLAGLADYFAPTVGVSGQMGIGFRGGKSALAKGIGADKNTNRGVVYGGVPTGPIMKVVEDFETETLEADDEKVKVIIAPESDYQLEDAGETSTVADETTEAVENYVEEMITQEPQIKNSIDVIRTPTGLKIQIRDADKKPMFVDQTANLTTDMQLILKKLAKLLANVPNHLSIIGYTSSEPVRSRKKDYTNWELSAERANATRRFLFLQGVSDEQIAWVIGKADNEPLDMLRPDAVVNNRIDIVLLRNNMMPEHKRSAPNKVFIAPDEDKLDETPEEFLDFGNESGDIEGEDGAASEKIKKGSAVNKELFDEGDLLKRFKEEKTPPLGAN